VAIDIADDSSVARAADDVRAHEGHVDVLINNAGVLGPYVPAEELQGPDASDVFNTNVVGLVRVTQAFLPLLRMSEHPAIVNVTSGMGSQALTHDPDRAESKQLLPLYSASKAAITMLTTQYAKALPDIRVNAADPGYTATDINHNQGHQTVAEGTDAIVTLATEKADAGTGRVIDRHGILPW
jgi:NAD(P)-dependent dehydrogenase (short-subunit alcohol dehydrogenase family)